MPRCVSVFLPLSVSALSHPFLTKCLHILSHLLSLISYLSSLISYLLSPSTCLCRSMYICLHMLSPNPHPISSHLLSFIRLEESASQSASEYLRDKEKYYSRLIDQLGGSFTLLSSHPLPWVNYLAPYLGNGNPNTHHMLATAILKVGIRDTDTVYRHMCRHRCTHKQIHVHTYSPIHGHRYTHTALHTDAPRRSFTLTLS